ncbi:MAG TPA: hypothetical protein VHH94_05075 [Gammaproteobacteria bacterium]|jgi:hypothetical protein|nr:hypothetical protein [Gammaproteobacteria bacterium]
MTFCPAAADVSSAEAAKDMTMAISGVLIAMGLTYLIPRVTPQS